MALDVTAEVTGVLQEMIRAACVNDGTAESGNESRNADILRDLLESAGLRTQTFEPLPGRASLVTRVEGSDPSAPTLLLMGHTDVVPVSEEGWSRDPHGGELVDGWVWGRGAVDMLNITASMAVATARLVRSGWRPRGSLVYLAVADEEAGGVHGAGWLMQHQPEQMRADCVLTESGGIPFRAPGGMRLWTPVGEKGLSWRRITVHGTPSHGSRPLQTDNALVKAAQVVTALAEFRPRAIIDDCWRTFVAGMGFDADLAAALTDPDRIWEGISELPPTLARHAHACTHLTHAPTVAHGGTKTNVIPDRVEIEIDIRTLPGQDGSDVDAMLRAALGEEMYAHVEVEALQEDTATISPRDTALWAAMERAAGRLRGDAELLPVVTTGGTDARFFRDLGVPSYGFGLFSDRITLERWSEMFHGNDERVDQESLRLSVEVWEAIARDLLG